jgi:hypothetical protein
MNDRDYHHPLSSHAVHKSITADDQLAQGWLAELWNDSS